MNDSITLAGDLMYKDLLLATFVIEDNQIVAYTRHLQSSSYFPYEMRVSDEPSALILSLFERVVPETRQRLKEDLEEVGLHYYDISQILRYQNATNSGDRNWVRFQDGPQTWEELRQKIGYTKW